MINVSERVFVKKECYDIYEYVGECPDCGTPQRALFESNVDKVCHECVFKRAQEIIIARMNNDNPYIGSIITNWECASFGQTRVEFIDNSLQVHDVYLRDHFSVHDYSITRLIPEKCDEPMVPKDNGFIFKIFKRFLK